MTIYRTAHAEAERRAKLADMPVDMVLPHVEAEIRSQPIRIEYEAHHHNDMDLAAITITTSDANPELNQFRVDFNIGHPWVQHYMLGQDTSPALRAKLEVFMLSIFGIDARTKEARTFYDREMQVWGQRLKASLDVLETILYPDGRPEEPDE